MESILRLFICSSPSLNEVSSEMNSFTGWARIQFSISVNAVILLIKYKRICIRMIWAWVSQFEVVFYPKLNLYQFGIVKKAKKAKLGKLFWCEQHFQWFHPVKFCKCFTAFGLLIKSSKMGDCSIFERIRAASEDLKTLLFENQKSFSLGIRDELDHHHRNNFQHGNFIVRRGYFYIL